MQLRHETSLLKEQNTATPEAVEHAPRTERDDGLLRTAVPIMIIAYATALGIATFTFWQSGDTLLSIAICVLYMAMFFGVPIMMSSIRNVHDARWESVHPAARPNQVTIFTGRVGRTEALLQIVTVPLVVAFAFAAFAVIWITVRP